MPEWLASLARGWFSELSDLKKLHIPRCLQEKEKMVNTLSLGCNFHPFFSIGTCGKVCQIQ